MEINGKEIAREIIGELKNEAVPKKYFAAVLCGGNEASKRFVARKKKAAEELGVDFRISELEEGLSSDDLRKRIGEIANHSTCGGVVVQLPLPEGVNRQYVLNAIPPEKDPDVLGERSLGAFCAGRARVVPPAAGTVREILARCGIDLQKSVCAVVGLGFLVGKPATVWLMNKSPEIILFEKGSDLRELKRADLVVSGTGEKHLLKKEYLKEGATVIDFGYFSEGVNVFGDLDPEACETLKNYTPTPGGTGPILIAKLLQNFFELNK